MIINFFSKFVFIGIGSNLWLGLRTPKDNVLEAIEYLKKLSDEPLQVSSLIESKPFDCPPGSPDFVNAVVALVPKKNETPLSFLYALQHIENSMGRVRSGLKNEARIIDLDLLLFKAETNASEELMLPHPEILNRNFVLEPLQEIFHRECFKKDEFDSLIRFIKKTPPKKAELS
ncbi:2-amino-4-hydroxy-6-hydroxymethyldihydropteridine diphosphokinase [Haliea sp. AH-315-K21]|uniref:2-amino-4-hydroxy-6-hydroxymethyldihydropteridine pyrophosphokinase n=1 Tax=SAR86 cluster bacterium TaxID=2030880 RepID=A0A2A5CIQ5_9GAMM|nr:2-amino-4-hydroxy-6-hydroxymethyldihydropteridine diphosphokinase [Haliea sp. AH-315-K21]MBN4075246.1 2-amino-4-hydroxy-6-hydroxymethyldihydropteridine diphosphokinase [Gammaproteobacteria bacterium AH-315-E17]PCJ43757.1 MAG: 2-amino-4-hydroxy-6-hydroxymethyldihydropteridine diphosphokinase [SAR86 cluster bacterium]